MFSQILKKLRESDSLSQTRFSKEIGFSQAAISAWENNTREPGIEALIKISKYFNVSVDYLVGNIITKKEKSPSDNLSVEEKELLENFRQLNLLNRMHVSAYAKVRLEEQDDSTTKSKA